MLEIAKVALLYKAIVNASMDCYKIFEAPGMSRYADIGMRLISKCTSRIIKDSDKLECMKSLSVDMDEITERLERKTKREIREIFVSEIALIPSNDYREVNRIIHNVLESIDSKEK